jgi:lysophospholipase L1-like esterase
MFDRCKFVLLAAALFAQLTGQSVQAADTKSIRVILVGDSTMNTKTGYGDALCALYKPDVKCVNLAKGGRSSKSFRAEGLWDNVQTLLKDHEPYRATYVLIQFGHNDQPGKAERSTDLATEFPANIARYVDEVKALGGTPVLVTPLTRRSFRDGVLKNDLIPWADAIRLVAKNKSVQLIDLNVKSAAAVAAMGTVEADTLAEEPPGKSTPSRFDYTHLGPKGASLFANMMAHMLSSAIPEMAASFDREKLVR